MERAQDRMVEREGASIVGWSGVVEREEGGRGGPGWQCRRGQLQSGGISKQHSEEALVLVLYKLFLSVRVAGWVCPAMGWEAGVLGKDFMLVLTLVGNSDNSVFFSV